MLEVEQPYVFGKQQYLRLDSVFMFILCFTGFHPVTIFIIIHKPTGLQLLTPLFIQQISLSICYVLGNEASLGLLV